MIIIQGYFVNTPNRLYLETRTLLSEQHYHKHTPAFLQGHIFSQDFPLFFMNSGNDFVFAKTYQIDCLQLRKSDSFLSVWCVGYKKSGVTHTNV